MVTGLFLQYNASNYHITQHIKTNQNAKLTKLSDITAGKISNKSSTFSPKSCTTSCHYQILQEENDKFTLSALTLFLTHVILNFQTNLYINLLTM